MIVLIDTNILLRLDEADHDEHATALAALEVLGRVGAEPVVVPQCCYEFHVVATRPVQVNGLGMDPDEADERLDSHLQMFRLLRDERRVFESWREVVREYKVRGKPAHDARLVAAMRRHDLSHLMTFNVADFTRYRDEITILDPNVVADT